MNAFGYDKWGLSPEYAKRALAVAEWLYRHYFRVKVRVGKPRAATPLDDFLTARWGAHVRRRHRTTYVPNRHQPWPLQDAAILELDDQLVASVGLPGVTGAPPDHVAFSEGVHAEFGAPYDARQPR